MTQLRSAQSMFNIVGNHLLKQNEKSMGINGCAYRGWNGLKCAVGILIPDKEYGEEMEGKSINGSWGQWIQKAAGIAKGCIDLTKKLQELHDYRHPYSWRKGLTTIASEYNLSMRWIK